MQTFEKRGANLRVSLRGVLITQFLVKICMILK